MERITAFLFHSIKLAPGRLCSETFSPKTGQESESKGASFSETQNFIDKLPPLLIKTGKTEGTRREQGHPPPTTTTTLMKLPQRLSCLTPHLFDSASLLALFLPRPSIFLSHAFMLSCFWFLSLTPIRFPFLTSFCPLKQMKNHGRTLLFRRLVGVLALRPLVLSSCSLFSREQTN